MKIYILRHEDRTQDCSFFAPLTETGLQNANGLVHNLKECKINMILSSPFIRTLQTVYPFAKEADIKIKLEYGLAEFHHADIIPPKAVGISLPEYLALSFNYDPIYKTVVKPTDITFPETPKNVEVRVKRVLRDIINKYYDTDYNIVLVTHQIMCNTIIKIVNGSDGKFKNKIPEKVLNGYQKGKLCLVFDKGWTYKPIN